MSADGARSSGAKNCEGSVRGGDEKDRGVVGDGQWCVFIATSSVNDVDERTWQISLLSKMSRSD